MNKTLKKTALITSAVSSFFGIFLYIAKIPFGTGWWAPPTLFLIIIIFLILTIFSLLEMVN